MQRISKVKEENLIKFCLPVLKHMRAAIVSQIRKDETLLDNYNEPKMLIKVLADASEIDALYYCGFLSPQAYTHCQKAIYEIKTVGKTTLDEAGHKTICEPPSNIIQSYLHKKNDYVPYTNDDADYALMLQGAAQLYEMIYFNRMNFETDLSADLKIFPWHVKNNPDQTTYLILFNLISLREGLKHVLPHNKISRKTQILLEALGCDFFQCACETLHAEGEEKKAKLLKARRQNTKNKLPNQEQISDFEITIGLNKSKRMMAMAYYLSILSGKDLNYTQNRRKMLLSGLIHAMREDIKRADFSKLFKKDTPQKLKLSQKRQEQILTWYDLQTAPFLKTIQSHVHTRVNHILKNLGNTSQSRM